MEERTVTSCPCSACPVKDERESQFKKDGSFEKRTELLRKAEGCKFFYHHGLYKADGKPENPLLMGARTCSLVAEYKCGHKEPRHKTCMGWLIGEVCGDWQER